MNSFALEPQSVSSKTNFWMIRTKRGFFFDEFLQKKFIAIGWNLITKSMIEPNKLTPTIEEGLKDDIKENYEEKKPGTALQKCVKFCNTIKEGDIAVIVGKDKVALAVIGEYFEEMSSDTSVENEKKINLLVEQAHYGVDLFTCPYTKRRKISVIKIIPDPEIISPYLQAAIARNWHSLCNLNEYAELILSSCLDTFFFKNSFTITFRIRKQNDINVLELANFISGIARLLTNNQPEKVSIKTALHSPGDIILQFVGDLYDDINLLVCYVMIFGGKYGNIEFNSVFSMIMRFFNRKQLEHQNEVTLKQQELKNSLLEEQVKSASLDNLKKMIELGIVDLGQLASISKNLEVELDYETTKQLQSLMMLDKGDHCDRKCNDEN